MATLGLTYDLTGRVRDGGSLRTPYTPPDVYVNPPDVAPALAPIEDLSLPACTPAPVSCPPVRLKYRVVIGDGVTTDFTLTHSLGTRDVLVEVVENGGEYDTVWCDRSRPTADTVRLRFATPPAADSLRVTVLA